MCVRLQEERHDKIVGVDPGVPASAKGPMFGTGQQAGYNVRARALAFRCHPNRVDLTGEHVCGMGGR